MIKPLIDTEELAALVPHRGKMFLLSRIVSWEPETHCLTAEFDITRDCLFFKDELDGLPAWAGFELMAQGISAFSGLSRRAQGLPPKIGFILSVSDMLVERPVLKETVRIEVEEDTVVNDVYAFRCAVYMDKIKAVSAKLTVMETDDISAVQR